MMAYERLLDVIRITGPVFGLMGLGSVLYKTGFMSPDGRDFLTKLTYFIALPALLFKAIAQQDVGRLLRADLFLATIMPMLGTALLVWLLVAVLRVRGHLAAAVIFSSFWGNTVYLGFPLSMSAFAAEGLSIAAVINAFCTPLFIIGAFGFINYYSTGNKVSTLQILRKSFNNPLIIAIVAGFVASVVLKTIRVHADPMAPSLVEAGKMVEGFLTLTGNMGLSCALVAMGGNLTLRSFTRNKGALGISICGKLLIYPLFTIICSRWLFPGLDHVSVGVLVILSAVPGAVASYVVARQLQIEEEFVTASVVVSTIVSIVTIPLCIYGIL